MTLEEAARVLGVSKPWVPESVKKAFKRKSRATHPDRNPDLDGNEFKAVSSAKEAFDKHFKKKVRPIRKSRRSSRPDVQDPPVDADPIKVGDYIRVIGVRCSGVSFAGPFRAQLVELKESDVDRFGQKVMSSLMIQITCRVPMEMSSNVVEIVVDEGSSPDVLVRDVAQRSYDKKNRVTSFWVHALSRPVIDEVYVHGRRSSWGF